MKSEFYSRIYKIRDKMERGDIQYLHTKDKRKWNRYCASLYAIEDAQCAVDSYCDSDFPNKKTDMYLQLYGLMQALFIQQDAGSGLLDSLEPKGLDVRPVYNQNKDLKEIRELRNYIVGHATEVKRNGGYAYVQINQSTLRKYSFHYCLYRQENDFQFEDRYVDLKRVIDTQYKGIMEILQKLCDAMDSDYREYLMQFKESKMGKIFDTLDYAREKVMTDDYLAEAGMSSVEGMIDQCKKALDARYGHWENQEEFQHTINTAEDLIQLRERVECGDDTSKVRKYLAELLFVKMEHLRELSEENDEMVEDELAELGE